MKTKRLFFQLMLIVTVMLANAGPALAADSDLDLTFSNPNLNNLVWDMVLQSDGKVLIGGQFTSIEGQTRNKVARLNANGTLDTSFGDPNVSSGQVYALAIQPDGKVLIGGGFISVGGQTRNKVARLNVDGTLDTSFVDPNVGFSGGFPIVNALAIQPDGKVLIGGDFSIVGGQTRYYIARLNVDGTVDTTFGASNPALNGYVETVALQSDGKVLVGGGFTMFGSTARNRVARLNANGTLDATFANPNVNASVLTLQIQPDGKVLIGGTFTTVGGTAMSSVARLNSTGTRDSTFVDPNVNTGVEVYKLALQSDGKIFIAGAFTTVGGQTRNRIARLNANGTLDATFGDPNVGSSVLALALQPDGTLLIGGAFTAVNGQTRRYAARLGNPPLIYAEPGSGTCGGNLPCVNSLQMAIDYVATGGEVRYYGGTYNEAVTLNKSATLNFVGSSNVTITGNFSISAGTFNAPVAYTLAFQGDFTNSGGTFSHNNGTAAFTGTGTQTITGNTTFYNLTIDGSSTLQTNAIITANGITHNAASVTQENRTISSNSTYTFNLAEASVNFDNRGSLNSLQVNRTESAHPQENFAGGAANILNRYYTLTPNANPTQADVCFGYTDAELGGLNESNLRLCRWTGSAWACPERGVSSNTTSNLVCADSVNEFSDWVIGQVGPTAVTLNSFSARTRELTGLRLAFGAIALAGMGWLVWRKCARQ
ncbi:MAG: delta-60 repeat domain-containing protein [Rhizobiaceae bacterium]|nr:delta-60 repeat domain-containing protein [Chloroflexota bacterium]